MRETEQSIALFRSRFGREPDGSAWAPGRVTVIGGHTDYNDGLVVSAPLPLGTGVALARNDDRRLRLFSDREREPVELDIGELVADPCSVWTRYVVGALIELGFHGVGLDVAICSNLPMRKGLASSAALIVATALAASRAFPSLRPPETLDLALLCQRAERNHVGVACGLLDPYTALHGKGGKLLLIDCAAKTHEEMRLPSDLSLVVLDSGIDRQLVGSLYNLRRAECRRVAERAGRSSLRDVTLEQLAPWRASLPVETRRAEHVIREIERVRQFWHALAARDFVATREVMAAAHRSCRDLFECSHPAVDALIARANGHPGCVGARLTGAGWGGATVHLVYKSEVESFCAATTNDRSRLTS